MPDTATRDVREAEPAKLPPKRSPRAILLSALAILVVLGGIAYGAYYVLVESHYVSTDNAYVGADSAQITPLVSAPVAQVLVGETDHVDAGQILVVLDDSDAQLALAEARADLARAQADAERANVDLQRRRALAPGGAVSADELTTAQGAASTAAALVRAAQARVEAAELTLSRMTIRAPISGIISNKNVQIGQRVDAGRPLMVVAPIGDAYVDANFKEPQLRGVQIGQPVTLRSDLYGDGVVFHGTVEGMSGGTGAAFSLIPAENASGNWIKVVQRVPVRIRLDAADLRAHPLRIGMSMTARIDISARPATHG